MVATSPSTNVVASPASADALIVFEVPDDVPADSLVQFLIGPPAVTRGEHTSYRGTMKFAPIKNGRAEFKVAAGRYGILFGSIQDDTRMRHIGPVGQSAADAFLVDVAKGQEFVLRVKYIGEWQANLAKKGAS
jgi:hypothetical protein